VLQTELGHLILMNTPLRLKHRRGAL